MRPLSDRSERGKGKAKTGEKVEFTEVNEHFEPVFNADFPSAVVEQRSQYKIRKSPRADGLSTIEAAVANLNALHPDRDFNSVLGAFHKMIEFQIEAMGEETFRKNYGGEGDV